MQQDIEGFFEKVSLRWNDCYEGMPVPKQSSVRRGLLRSFLIRNDD